MISNVTGCSVAKNGSSKSTQNETQVTEDTQTENSRTIKHNEAQIKDESEIIDLSGIFYTASGDTANIELLSKNKWKITYSTSDGDVIATFETKWGNSGKIKQSKTPMNKSDNYSGFNVLIEYVDASDIKIIMDDGNAAHEMVFTSQKPKENEKYEVVLKGDLSPFTGQFSNNEFNKQIADSGFTLGGYSPDDYYSNKTTVFSSITENGYWNGIASHGSYEVIASDMPKKVDGYFEVRVHGTNAGANNGEITFFLVPPNVSGPDGTLSDNRRVFQVYANGEALLKEYQKEEWWKEYQ